MVQGLGFRGLGFRVVGLGFRIVVLMPRSGTTTIFTMLSIAYSCFYSYSLILTIHRSATDKGGCRYTGVE